jgi:glycosyltransferase involved in cell wall biosynthesis
MTSPGAESGAGADPLITVCTPTFNRGSHLARVHASLRTQTFRDFEWLVVDDGSTDDTGAIVEHLTLESNFPVRYIRKHNGGKHTALNRGVREARGYFCAVLDSDDWYLPECLARLKRHWDAIPRPEDFAEVQGLCSNTLGEPLGDPFPEDVFDSDYYTNTEILELKGDRTGMIRTNVLRAYPFPEEFGPVLVPEAIVWNRISTRFRLRGFNEIVACKEYLAGGLTRRASTDHVALSAPRLLYVEELLQLDRSRPINPRRRLKAYANLTRNSLHQRRPLGAQARRAPSKLAWISAFPLGLLLYLRDFWRTR